jgi:HAD superfamily hydrolase (TIGR01459 family)
MRALKGLGEIAGRYDVILSDVWGVVHNGISRHPGAAEALGAFRAQGGHVVLITNAPRPSPPLVAMLDGMGVARTSYDAMVSSGDATRSMIAAYSGRVVHYVGPPGDNDSLFAGLGVTLGPVDEASAIVVTDLDSDDDTPELYTDRMTEWLGRGLPLICANPDRVVEHGDRLVYCGGALADLYEARGGLVRMAGKPYRPIYDEALRLAEEAAGYRLDRGRVLAIGDSVRTDAIGAANAGLDLLFVTGSIHAAEIGAFDDPDARVIETLLSPTGVRLAGFMPRLVW